MKTGTIKLFNIPKGGFPLSGRDIEILGFYSSFGFFNFMKTALSDLEYENILNGYMAFTLVTLPFINCCKY